MNEAEQMLTSLLDCPRVDLYVDPKPLSSDQKKTFERMKTRREQGEPLQYILGTSVFMNVELSVGPMVLIPRPETEILVELVMDQLKLLSYAGLRGLDLGTGSGNISIALAKNKDNINMTAIDISQGAIELAEKNARQNGVRDKIHFVCDDMAVYLRERPQAVFNFIVSNPPYIPTGALSSLPADVMCEPQLALDGGADGMDFYRIIIEMGVKHIKPGGFLFLELGDGQFEAVLDLLKTCPGYETIDFHKDYTGVRRIIYSRLRA